MALPAAGQQITDTLLDGLTNAVTQVTGAAQSTSLITMGAAQDLTGTSLTFTTAFPNTKIMIWATFDVDSSGTTSVFVGTCFVDGVLQAGEAHSQSLRNTCFQMWIFTIAAAGNHTIKLQGAKSGGSDTMHTNGIHTKWHGLIFGP